MERNQQESLSRESKHVSSSEGAGSCRRSARREIHYERKHSIGDAGTGRRTSRGKAITKPNDLIQSPGPLGWERKPTDGALTSPYLPGYPRHTGTQIKTEVKHFEG